MSSWQRPRVWVYPIRIRYGFPFRETGKRGRLSIASAVTGEILALAPVNLPVLAIGGAMLVKIIALLAALFVTWWAGGTGWGAVLGALAVVVLIILILIEVKGAAPPPAAPGPPGLSPPPPPGPGDELLKRAKKLREKLNGHVEKRDKYNPFDDDVEELKKILEGAEKEAKDLEKNGKLTPEEKEEIDKALEKLREGIPK
jgi:hypothetical protein